jgi:hypothetical protein
MTGCMRQNADDKFVTYSDLSFYCRAHIFPFKGHWNLDPLSPLKGLFCPQKDECKVSSGSVNLYRSILTWREGGKLCRRSYGRKKIQQKCSKIEHQSWVTSKKVTVFRNFLK